MADDNEDQWLYGGDSGDGKDGPEKPPGEPEDDAFETAPQDEPLESENNANELENEAQPTEQETFENSAQPEGENEVNENGTKENSSQEDGEAGGASDSDSDDDVHVVIGDIKSTPAYSNLNIKRGGLLSGASGPIDKLNKQAGKFSIDEFETIGVIDGIPAHEFNLDQLEDKPWRQPGADITDYFNYGFNEDTWRAYCERQKRMRTNESGVGLVLGGTGGTGPGSNAGFHHIRLTEGGGVGGGMRIPQVAITNDNSKYSGIMGPKRAGPPPGRKMAGTIDVIGGTGLASRRNLDKSPPKENTIQVMTAERREYSRKPGFPDLSVPPPGAVMPPTFDMPPPGYHGEPPPYFAPEVEPYYQSYEPVQDNQWGNDPTWQPTNLAVPIADNDDDKEKGIKAIPTMVPPVNIPMIPHQRDMRDREIDSMGRELRERERDREREKDSMSRDRDRDSATRDDDRERDRSRSQYRHKERHRHRSRSRSRRHKSRSRSPSRRKKKSRRSEKERSKEESD